MKEWKSKEQDCSIYEVGYLRLSEIVRHKVRALEQEIDVSRTGAPQRVVMDNPRSILHSNIKTIK